jgi:glycosyltransferase involved in cell wall biosynthesis
MDKKILVAIPCYKCAAQIPRVINEFDAPLLERIEKVIIIDNQSPDDTRDAAIKAIEGKGFESKFMVVRNNENYNLGGTHKVAFNFALKNGIDYVAILHGDNQAKTQELNSLIDEIEKDETLGAALGARFMKGSRIKGYALSRIWGNRGLNLFFTLLTFKKTKDLGSGLNIFKMTDLADKKYLFFSDSLAFNVDLLLDYYRKKTKLKFIPISWSETDQVSNARNFKIGWMILKKLLAWRLNPNRKYATGEIDYSFTQIF